MSEYRVIENKKNAEYEFVLVSPSGEELNGGDGLFNKTSLEVQANMLNQELATSLERIKALEETQINLFQALGEAHDTAQCYRDDIKTMIDGAGQGWTVDRLRRYAVEVMQGIVKREGGQS